MSKSPSCRFYLQDPTGRTRSSVWKVWTGCKGQDIYIAPRRIASEFKLSIHRDGTNQIGYYSKQVKQQLRAADKHYLDRRPRRTVPYYVDGWTHLCTLVFNSREFEAVPLEDDGKPVQLITAPASSQDACILVLATDTGSASDLDTAIIGDLPRPDGGTVVLTGGPISHDPSILAAVDTDRSGFGWQAPGSRGSDEPYGFVFAIQDVPRFAEYSTRKHAPPPLVPRLPELHAIVRPWDDAPGGYAESDNLCAVLACSNEGASLYIDPRTHCSQSHLVSDANDLIKAFRIGKTDREWGRLPDGRMATGITTRITAEAAGMSYLPNPLKN